MQNDKKISNLLAVGFSTALAQKIIDANYSLSRLKLATKSDLLKTFSEKDVETVRRLVTRRPIQDEELERLIEESDWKCCMCWDIKKESPVIIHHIVEHAKSQDDSYENLVVLCLDHHAKAHSKWEISRSPYSPEFIRNKKTTWIKAVADFRAGRRCAPGEESSFSPLIAVAPPPPILFTGREIDCVLIKEGLQQGQHIAIQGMGGIGKSATARRIAADVVTHYSGGIFWGSLSDTEGNPNSLLQNWFQLCTGESAPQIDAESLALHVRTLLTARQNTVGPLLVVLDDVRREWIGEFQIIQSAIPLNVPQLFTLRNEILAGVFDAKVYPLGVMTSDEALELLRRYSDTSVSDEDKEHARELMDAVGYLPLAIELIGKRLAFLSRKPGFHISSLCREVKKHADSALNLPDHRGLVATFSITYRELSESSRRIFRTLGVFPNIPLLLGEIASVFGACNEDTEDLLDDLVACALLHWGHGPATYVLHPLIFQYSQALLSQNSIEMEELRSRYTNYYVDFAQNHAGDDVKSHGELTKALPHFIKSAEYASSNHNSDILDSLAQALWVKSSFLTTQCYMKEAIEILERAVNASKHHYNVRSEAIHLHHLSVGYAHMGKTELAFNSLNQSLMINRNIGNRYDEAANLNNLGSLHRDTGNGRKALECYHEAMDIAEESDNIDAAIDSVGNLGSCYRTMGNSQVSISYYRKGLELSRLANRKLSIGNSLSNVGLIYMDMGNCVAAKICIQEALQIAREIGDIKGEGNRLGHLGLISFHTGDLQRSIDYSNQALEITRRIGQRLNQSAWLSNLGIAYRSLGRLEESIPFFEEALSISREVLAKEAEGKCLLNLGAVQRDLGNFVEARVLFAEALSVFTSIDSRHAEQVRMILDAFPHTEL